LISAIAWQQSHQSILGQHSTFRDAIRVVFQCPINMRSIVNPPLDGSECVAGSSLAWSEIEIKPSDSVWDVSRSVTDVIRSKIDEGLPLMYWGVFNRDGIALTPPATANASNMGNTKLSEALVGPDGKTEVRVVDAKMLSGFYDFLPPTLSTIAVHVYTVLGELNYTLTTTSPAWSVAEAEALATLHWSVISLLLTTVDGGETPVEKLVSFMMTMAPVVSPGGSQFAL